VLLNILVTFEQPAVKTSLTITNMKSAAGKFVNYLVPHSKPTAIFVSG